MQPELLAREPARRILVVDDELQNRDILEQFLVDDGFEVLLAEDGAVALEIIETGHVDLVLLDIQMPRIDGIEACRRIRNNVRNLTLPIVFITASDDAQSRIRGREVGGDDYLVKPFNSAELRARIRSLLLLRALSETQETARAEAVEELDRVRAQLLRAERLATLGTLAAGVGHELSNIATVLISTTAEIERKRKQGEHCDPDVYEDLGRARDHVRHHAKALLALGRPGPDYAERLDVREVVKSTIDMLGRSGRTKFIAVHTSLPLEPMWALVNRTRIEQVLVNLIGNAVDAFANSHQDPSIRIVINSAQSRVRCSVVDNGSGISPETLARIFEPYFTTKPPDRGTGLGLPVVVQIVESYGGRLTVQSEPGRGSAFTFDLPNA